MIVGPPRGARESAMVSVVVGGDDPLVVVLFEPGLEATIVFVVLVRLLPEDSRRLLAAVGRNIEEGVFNCGVGEDEAEE